ncbi:hypothetical protein C3H44_08395 [Campylobacter jejuni]|uniref:hypothetical protein n=1 Tax=Campylobacter TaxID=194 RepID=UPI000F809ECE|nr:MULTISPECIES: hypothetical protein [Campylobacter]RTI67418.1 hypothetical protein C3I19_08185 [Campylobacter jejuni]RTI75395.1 hypothetical protein C3I11_08480 [Campylobacter jejuni]RTI89737.1 hypothetical protein C3I03_08655 [Campylobacter jejuni]RTJ14393.1 hypothetical protein C3H90_08550 [Campylobacter jejuni]RTJ24083.1 hypothetical protein C3H82_08295 [Campylobacter jejuni]
MKIKNFTLIASNHNLEIELKNLTKNANKIIFICSDFDGYKEAKNSLYKTLHTIEDNFKIDNTKTFKIIHLNQANKDEITKEQKFSSDKNLSSIKKIIFNNLKFLNNAINQNENKTLNKIIDENNVENIENFLKEIQKELNILLKNIKESNYFEQEIKPKIQLTLDTLFNTLLKNITQSNDDEYKQIIRAIAKFFINILDSVTNLKKPVSLVKKNPYVFVVNTLFEAYNSSAEYQEYKEQKYYYDFAYPLLELITSKLYPIIALCNEEILSDVLIIDDKVLLDFSSYSNVPSISLYKNSFYKVILDEEFQGIFDNFLENNLKFENEKLDNTLLVNSSLNNFDTTLKKAINLNISKLNHFFYAEYPDLNSSMLVEMILDKKNTDQINTTKMGKNYLLITNPPQLNNAGLCEDLYQKKLGAIIKNRPKALTKNEKLALKGDFPSKRDYGSYFIERDVKKEDDYVLQLCPFVKLDGQIYQKYKGYFNFYNQTYSWMKLYLLEHINERLEYEKVKQDFAYIDSFFKLPKELEEISEKEKEKVEEYVELFNNYLDNINSRYDQTQSNLNSETLMFKTYENVDFKKYSPLTVVLLTLTLYVLQKDLAFTQEYSLGYKLFQANIGNYQKIKIPNYFNEYISFIPDDIYFYDNDKKIYIFLSKELNKNKKEDEVIYLDELAKAMFENDFEEEDQTYVNFLKTLNESFDEEIEFEENIQTDKTLPSKKDLDKSIQDIMLDKELAKLSIDITFFNIIKQLFPFTEFFMSQPDFFKKMILFFIDSSLDKKYYGNKLFSSFKAHFFKELGIFYALSPKGRFIKINPKSKKSLNKLFLYQIGTNYYYFNQLEYASELKKSKSFSRLDKAKQIHLISKVRKQLAIDFSIKMSKDLSVDILKNLAGSFIDTLLPTNYERLKILYEKLMYEKFTYNYDFPLAVKKEEYITYPLLINSRFMSFDLSEFIFGSLLCTGGLNYYPSIACATTSSEAREFALKRLLSYIILDEKRSAFMEDKINEGKYILNDKEFFEKNNIELRNCNIYKLEHFQRKEEYKIQHPVIKQHPILAYNDTIQILYEYANGIYNTTQDEKGKFIEDRQKARRLMENLEAIGQHNLEVMYKGIKRKKMKDESKNEDGVEESDDISKIQDYSNKFIGRLATTIIMEDGLYIG